VRIALVIGHSDLHKGASMTKPFKYVQEYEFNTVLAAMIHAKFSQVKIPCRVFTRDIGGLRNTYSDVQRWDADLSVELHFNASASNKPHGSEVLHGPQAGSKDLAEYVQQWLVSSLNTRSRGGQGAG